VGECTDEILESPVAIPVARPMLRCLDLGNPVDELQPGGVDVVANRVDHHLAVGEPAGADHAGAVQYRRPPRDAAPHVDAGVPRRTFLRMQLPADNGMQSVAGDDDGPTLWRQWG